MLSMQAHSVHGFAALLILLFFVLDVDAVCRHCWGTIAGCPGGPNDDNCTTITGAAANAAALAAGATAALSLVGLLPVYLLRVFSPRILATLATVARRGGGAMPYGSKARTLMSSYKGLQTGLLKRPTPSCTSAKLLRRLAPTTRSDPDVWLLLKSSKPWGTTTAARSPLGWTSGSSSTSLACVSSTSSLRKGIR